MMTMEGHTEEKDEGDATSDGATKRQLLLVGEARCVGVSCC